MPLADTFGMPPEWNDFFIRYTRLEFALKEAKFVTTERQSDNAKTDWLAFIASLPNDFWRSIEFVSQDERIFVDAPPKRHMLNGLGALEWVDTGSIENNTMPFESLRRLRNNLFHGGKGGDPFDGRSRRLLRAGIEIINRVLASDEKLRSIIENGY